MISCGQSYRTLVGKSSAIVCSTQTLVQIHSKNQNDHSRFQYDWTVKLVALIPDTHRPFHHRRAYNLMLNVLSDLSSKLSEIVILGDYADYYSVTSHQKDPRLPQMLEREVEDVNDGLDELSGNFPKAKITYIQGNHEYRLERYLQERAPAIFGMVDNQTLFKIHQRPNFRWIPYGPAQCYRVAGSKLFARHEPFGSSSKTTAARGLCSIVFGHTHRMEESHIVGLDGKGHVSFSVGWLGDKRKDQVFGYVKAHHQWQLGFGLVWVDPKTRYFYHEKILILDNLTCMVNGKVYKP